METASQISRAGGGTRMTTAQVGSIDGLLRRMEGEHVTCEHCGTHRATVLAGAELRMVCAHCRSTRPIKCGTTPASLESVEASCRRRAAAMGATKRTTTPTRTVRPAYSPNPDRYRTPRQIKTRY